MRKQLLRATLVVAAIGIGAAAAAYATASDSGTDINACQNKTNGNLRVVADASQCRNSEIPLSWNATGPAGAVGATGATGAAGADGADGEDGADATALWAYVAANAGLQRGSHVVSTGGVPDFGIGSYEVIFDRDVRGCSYQATLGQNSYVSTAPGDRTIRAGEITVYERNGQPNGVFVQVTDDAGGGQRAQEFHLAVFC
jgi:hypothetical protein